MRSAWCPDHRGVMRISFFDPSPPHFNDPCPRCNKALVQSVDNSLRDQYIKNSLRNDYFEYRPLGSLFKPLTRNQEEQAKERIRKMSPAEKEKTIFIQIDSKKEKVPFIQIDNPKIIRLCPDGGACHHGCKLRQGCFRVEACGPLSGVFENDEWPEEIVSTNKSTTKIPTTKIPTTKIPTTKIPTTKISTTKISSEGKVISPYSKWER